MELLFFIIKSNDTIRLQIRGHSTGGGRGIKLPKEGVYFREWYIRPLSIEPLPILGPCSCATKFLLMQSC